ncbi:MMPL family transporter [Noviherbaspirillum sedimenti]|uniref:Transporter n=1 Tax=Noviherbaspirillum sedimenti TaxID=2320865 RepID=A0A3A3GKA9_9BURK|nr:transporter [Noviherbaspirillum sedimenti]RJG02746.1 transporter [Noviherbaspirillum sedimenti]
MKRHNLLALAWGVVVAILLAHGVSLWLNQRIAPDTDILTLLPTQERDPAVQQAFAHMADAAQQKLIVLVGASDWEQARRAADAYRAVLSPHADLLQFADKLGEQTQQDWLALFQRHRLALMTAEDETALRTQDRQYWVDAALSKLYSPFAGPKIGAWQDDPFGLFGGWVQARAQETPVRPRDGRLFVADGERTYVVMPMILRVPAFSMDAQETVMPLLAKARQAASSAVANAEVLEAGMILHAAAAGKQASGEVSTIGIGSLLGIVLLIWFSFRSLKPFAYIALLLGVGFLGALTLCLLLFDRVHLLTLVFGATLIGVAQDYGIYFLCHRLGAGAATTSPQLLRHLLPSLLLTLLAAAIGYTGLALTPFPGLRQMAVFSVAGLVFAWLTVVCWYPAMIGPMTLKNARQAQAFSAVLKHWPVLRADRRSALALLAVAVLLGFGWSRLGVNDDIRSLQNPPKQLVAEQLKLGKLLDAPTPVQFYLVRGASADQVLQREEALKRRLDPLIAQRTISGYQAISNWVPSAQAQSGRHKLVKEKLMGDGAALPVLASRIGEDADWVHAMRERAATVPSLTVDEFMKAPASEPWRHLWLGRLDDDYASVVAVRGLSLAKLPALQQAAIGIDGVQWVDKVADISSLLGRYRQYMGWALLFSYAAVFCLLFLRYRAATWRVLAPTALASGVTLALLGIAGQQLQLFHVLALMLLLGIGVDYGVFFQERPDRREASAWMAVSLSAASTLLSFGLLGLSKTPALQAFGLTMLLGTALVWLIVPCFAHEHAAVAQAVRMEEVCE